MTFVATLFEELMTKDKNEIKNDDDTHPVIKEKFFQKRSERKGKDKPDKGKVI